MEMKASATRAKLNLVTSMILFGTIGIFIRNITLPSSIVSITRGFLGSMFLLIIIKMKGLRFSWPAIKKNMAVLTISGGFLGYTWILLFEAYQRTTIATATLSYYLAPILVTIMAVVFFKERLTFIKTVCILSALLGMVLISGFFKIQSLDPSDLTGMMFGVGAAFLYAVITILNKRISLLSPYESTFIQLLISSLFIIPYALITVDFSAININKTSLFSLVIVAVVHTGITYALYFSSLSLLKAQTIAILSYIDPLVSVLVSALILKENLTLYIYLGGLLILGSTLFSEIWDYKEKHAHKASI